KADTSAEAIILDLEFDAELLADSAFRPESAIEDQLLFTIGHLNGDNAVGRLDKVKLTDVQTSRTEAGRTKISYHAVLQVAWRKRQGVPETYAFTLPIDVGYQAQKDFAEAYGHTCVDWGAHDVDSGSMWYYFRPHSSRCRLDEAHITKTEAAVSVSPVNTTGKYPEYDKIWADDLLTVVAVFGKYEDGATTASDAGVSAYNTFVAAMRRELPNAQTSPEGLPNNPGVEHPEVSITAELPDGRYVIVNALLVDNVRTAGAEFNARYAELSRTADLILYNGHAGLGANIRALASKGDWQPGQYSIVFLNGCDTYAYVDAALFQAHAAVNPDDPKGTKYVDVVTNAMPAFFREMSDTTLAMVRGLLAYDSPRTYEQIFKDIDSSQIVLVSGEEDNTFTPGAPDEPVDVQPWAGVSLEGELARGAQQRHETAVVPAGTYTFEMTGTGDADLYVRVGLAPTATEYDCRPYKGGSVEACTVELPAPSTLHVMVEGYAAQSTFTLVGKAQ
ncbi:MAG: PPC domain-containing protein, partial [Myxococcales bacterium]|nr:PPC domain-containing protein [Myxococcales bacterium]